MGFGGEGGALAGWCGACGTGRATGGWCRWCFWQGCCATRWRGCWLAAGWGGAAAGGGCRLVGAAADLLAGVQGWCYRGDGRSQGAGRRGRWGESAGGGQLAGRCGLGSGGGVAGMGVLRHAGGGAAQRLAGVSRRLAGATLLLEAVVAASGAEVHRRAGVAAGGGAGRLRSGVAAGGGRVQLLVGATPRLVGGGRPLADGSGRFGERTKAGGRSVSDGRRETRPLSAWRAGAGGAGAVRLLSGGSWALAMSDNVAGDWVAGGGGGCWVRRDGCWVRGVRALGARC